MSNPILIPVQILCNKEEFTQYVPNFLKSVIKQEGLGEKFELEIVITTYQVINDEYIKKVLEYASESVKIRHYEINGDDKGYGEKQNIIWRTVTSKIEPKFDWFITANPDLILMSDCINQLIKMARSRNKVGMVEARQFPIENPPREFDYATGEVSWCSGAMLMISKDVFEEIAGFDDKIFLYCEDVDLSWRVLLTGRSCLYCYPAIAAHMTKGMHLDRYLIGSNIKHHKMVCLSHLILIYKFFYKNQSSYRILIDNYWNFDAGIDLSVREIAYSEFEKIRPEICTIQQDNNLIKVKHIGLYEEIRNVPA